MQRSCETDEPVQDLRAVPGGRSGVREEEERGREFHNRVLAFIVEAFGKTKEETFAFYSHYMPSGEQTWRNRDRAYQQVAEHVYSKEFQTWKNQVPSNYFKDTDSDDVTTRKRTETLTWLEKPQRDWAGKLAAQWRGCLLSATDLDTSEKKEFCCRSYPSKDALAAFHMKECKKGYSTYEVNENRLMEKICLQVENQRKTQQFLKKELAKRRKQFEEPRD